MKHNHCRAGASPAGQPERLPYNSRAIFAALDVYHGDTPHSAAMNMAIDEALLEQAEFPSIRFYVWHSPALSFGYFGKFANVASDAGERDLVRRWTGGGMVLHGDDLTYAIVIPSGDTAFGESSISIYEKIHHALCRVLVANGQHAEIAAETTRHAQRPALNAQLPSNKNCFANPVRADVMINGCKVAGAAQRRTRRGLLQQGSIQGINFDNGLAQRFAEALSSNSSKRKVDRKIFNRAQEIAACKYGTDAWLRMR